MKVHPGKNRIEKNGWPLGLGIGLAVLLVLGGALLCLNRVGAAAQKASSEQAAKGGSVSTEQTSLKNAVDEGVIYYADGKKVSLLKRTDQFVVALRTTPGTEMRRTASANLARLTSPSGGLSDFTEVKALEAGLRVLQNTAAANVTDDVGRARLASRLQTATTAVKQSALVAWTAPVYVNAQTGVNQVATDEVIVALKQRGRAETAFQGDARINGCRPLLGTPDQIICKVAAGGGAAAINLANSLNSDSRFAWAVPNFYQDIKKYATPNDPLYGDQWHLNNTGQFGGTPDADVDAPEAWDVTPGGSSNVVIAVVDDGMEYTHPDLAPNLFTNTGEIPNNNIDDDGNGWVDDVNGWDFTSNDNNPGASSSNDAHATSVGGVAAAAGNNNLGVTGMAYRSRLLPVRIFGDNGNATTDANIASAVYYAAGRTADGLGTWRAGDIMNNSWGGGSSSSVITAAFTWASTNGRNGKGVISFVATGNGFASAIAYPANLAGTLSGVIAVGASTNLDVRASYSNYGPQIDFVAPSNGIGYGGTYDIVTVDRQGANGYNNAAGTAGDYTNEFGGTSSATPLAAGIGALLLALDANLTAAQVRAILRGTTELIGPLPYVNGFNTQYGYGRVNANNAVRALGVAEVQVFDTTAEILSGGTISGFLATVSQSQTRSFRVRNTGTVDLNLSGLTVNSGPFSVAANFSDTTLSLGESATFSVTFTPTTGGPASGALSFSTNDSDEGTFTINLNGTGQVASVAGYAFEDWDGNGVRDADEPGLGGWQVLADQNNNGVVDYTNFTNSANQPLVDGGMMTSNLSVSGLGTRLGDIKVTLNINHTYDQDLQVTLISPAGTPIELFSGIGGNRDNFTNTVLDDEATTPISAGSAPFTGSFRPFNPLAGFAGENPNGLWQLKVVDREAPDGGTLLNWSLSISTEAKTVTNSNGFYQFLNLPAGSYAVQSIAQNGWNVTGPAGGSHPVTITNVNDSFVERNLGQVKQNSIYGQQFNDLNGNGVREANEPGAAGWQLNFGANAGAQTFTTSPNQAIPDLTTITSNLAVTGVPGLVGDVNVKLNIAHTWDSDLNVFLVSPSGTVVELFTGVGGSADNFTDTILDDEAATAITAGTAPFTGSFRPEGVLSGFDGEFPIGTWQLRVSDDASGDPGTLLSWSLTIEPQTSLVTPATGKYRITVSPGMPTVITQVNQVGWRPTVPVGGSYSVTLASGQTLTGNDFGNVLDSTAPTVDIVDVTPDPRSTAVSSIAINFSETVTGFDRADLTLTREGNPVDLSSATLSGSGANYNLSGLNGLTANGGSYVLTLTASGSSITDLAQNPLQTGASDSWFNCMTIPFSLLSLPNGQIGVAYSQALLTPVNPNVSFSVTGGTLPTGLSLASNGTLAGNPTQSGSYSFTVTMSGTGVCPNSQGYTVAVTCPTITLNPPTLPNGTVGVNYNQTLSASPAGSYSFAVTGGALPPGVALTPATGALTGTPTTPGTFTFSITASLGSCTASQSYTVIIGCPTFALANLAAATAGSPYSGQFVASPSGGNFQFSSANKPAWLTLTSSGGLSGTPPTAGTFSFNVVVSGFGSCTQTLPVTLVVNCPAVTLTPAQLPNASLGAAYSATVTASPAGTTYSYLLLGSPLPPGLSLDSATGLISGTPTAAGNYAFVVTALGWGDCRATQTYNLLVTATCPTVSLTPSSLAGGTVGTAYSQNLTASGATGPFTWAVTSGSLPAGLSLASGGSLSGTPTAAGSFNFTVTATNGSGCAGSQSFTLVVTCPTLTLGPASLTNATAGVAYNQTLTLTPSGAATFSLATGSLPPGLNLTSAGTLSGTATATGSYSFSVKAERGSCSVTKAYTLVVSCPTVTVNPASLPNGSAGAAYNQTLSATPSGSYSFAVSSGSLPAGLSLSTAGVLSGTPTASGTFTFTVRATAFGSCSGTRNFTLTIGAACPTVTLPSLANATRGVNYYGDLSTTTPSGSYTFSLTSGSLPPGLVLDNLFGALTGTPTTAGTFVFTLQAANANGCVGTRSYSFVVSNGAAARAELADYDGDGASDPALWSASDGVWRVQPSSGAAFSETAWGGAGDVTLLGDYDGDGKTDLAVFRPSNATWYVKRSSDGQALVRSFGQSSDVPVPGDYDGDGRTDFAVWRGKTGEWLIQRSSDGQAFTQAWGSSAAAYQDTPVAGDFDGDGQTDLAVFRRTTGTWLIKRSSDAQFFVKAWGYGTDTPVAADYDGDGRTDIAVWRGATGEWFVLRSSDGGFAVTKWGGAAYQDVPVAGDYDGDGVADLTVWRAPARQWFIQATRAAAAQVVPQGQASDAPVGARR